MLMRTALGVLAMAGVATTPVQGATGCWDGDSVSAARVMEFQIALMVATLRCTALNFDMQVDFRRFAETHKQALKNADLKLQRHFGGSDKASHALYQNFQTRVSNRHSMRDSTVQSCTLFRDVAAELAKSETSADTLASFANALIPEPSIDGARCVQTANVK